ncbi:MAG: methionine--tRNA ligase [Patescibacteria group bacterium]
MKKPFYITNAIPYVNAAPHVGYGLEIVQSDTVARYQRLLGKDVRYLCGTDENSLKNVQAAEQVGKPVKTFVDEHAAAFFQLKKSLGLSFDDFIRTTEERHFTGAQTLWSSCNSNDIYKKKYKGLYCVGCELFYTEDELVEGLCPEHKKPPQVVEEENYFFKLSNYQKQLEEIIEKDEVQIIPLFRKEEVLQFIRGGLQDFSISRSIERAHGWGVPVPGDPDQIMYVWFDALSNYITALDYGHAGELYTNYWVQKQQPSREVVHVIGKGIIRFHAVYWLGMLLSAKIPLPTTEFVHGYITVNGEKMSKSVGNVLNPRDVVEAYGTDPVRYFLLGGMSSYHDSDFSDQRFREFYTAHLVDGVGNLTSRILTMLEKYSANIVPDQAPDIFSMEDIWETYHHHFKNYQFDDVIRLLQSFESVCNEVINRKKPWEMAKQGEDVQPLLYQLAEALRHIGIALLPIIPTSAEKILVSLGIDSTQLSTLEEEQTWGGLKKGAIINKGSILFPRL